MKKYWIVLFVLMLAAIVLLPPILHGNKLLVINNDTASHLAVFESIKSGNAQFSYLGQEIVGYSLVWIEGIIGINLPTLFMWFNFLVLLIGGLATGLLVAIVTKNIFGGMLSAFLILFGIGSVQHLFWSGTIFNLIEYLILLPILLLCFYFTTKKTSVKIALPTLIGVGILMTFFHPSFIEGLKYILRPTIYMESVINPITAFLLLFGIVNIVLVIVCWIGIRTKEDKTDLRTKTIFGIIFCASIIMLILANFALTPYSSRLAINAFLLLGIALCIYVGLAMKSKSKLVRYSIIGLVVIGAIPNLINWLTWVSFYNPLRGTY